MHLPSRQYILRLLPAALWLLLALAPAARGEEAVDTLDLFNAWQGESAAAVRSPKPLSRTAETVTVLTRRDIDPLNAHTLADILTTVPGLQLTENGGAGNLTYTFVQGTSFTHVLVVVDGVPLTNSNSFPDVALVPARMVEQVEIVKGPASSVWGPALGGIISVTTRTPADRPAAGTVDLAGGTRGTADGGAVLSGTSGRLGYLLSGGYLRSDGLRENMQVSTPTGYGKVTWQLPGNGQLWGTLGYVNARRGELFTPVLGIQEDMATTRFTGSLGLRRELTPGLELELGLRHANDKTRYVTGDLDNVTFADFAHRFRSTGGTGRLTWRSDRQLAVAGFDYDHINYHRDDAFTPGETFRRGADRWGVYGNDTLDLGPVSIIPGVRYDHTEHGDQWSPSLGLVWRLTDDSLLRGYIARGFSLPDITVDHGPERTWTARLGVESEAVPYLWLRGTLFRTQVWDFAGSFDGITEWTTYGVETEARTAPVFHTSLSAGYSFMDSRSPDGAWVHGQPRHTVNLALKYDDRTFRGTLTGRHINWNGHPEFNGRYHSLLVDLFLGAKVLERGDRTVELFFSGRNLFNANNYADEVVPNERRRLEGGVKVSF